MRPPVNFVSLLFLEEVQMVRKAVEDVADILCSKMALKSGSDTVSRRYQETESE